MMVPSTFEPAELVDQRDSFVQARTQLQVRQVLLRNLFQDLRQDLVSGLEYLLASDEVQNQ